jgi:hypothetical protein
MSFDFLDRGRFSKRPKLFGRLTFWTGYVSANDRDFHVVGLFGWVRFSKRPKPFGRLTFSTGYVSANDRNFSVVWLFLPNNPTVNQCAVMAMAMQAPPLRWMPGPSVRSLQFRPSVRMWITVREMLDAATVGRMRCVARLFVSHAAYSAVHPPSLAAARRRRQWQQQQQQQLSRPPCLPSRATWLVLLQGGDDPSAEVEAKRMVCGPVAPGCAPFGGGGGGGGRQRPPVVVAATIEQRAWLQLQRQLLDVLVNNPGGGMDPAELEHFMGPGVPQALHPELLNCHTWADHLVAAACCSHRQLEEWAVRELGWYLLALRDDGATDWGIVEYRVQRFVEAGGVNYLVHVVSTVELRDPRGLRPTALQGVRICVPLLDTDAFRRMHSGLAITLLVQLRQAWCTDWNGWKDLLQTLTVLLAIGGPRTVRQLWGLGGMAEVVGLVRQAVARPSTPETADVIALVGNLLRRRDANAERLCTGAGLNGLHRVLGAMYRSADAYRRLTAGAGQDFVQTLLTGTMVAVAQCAIMAIRVAPPTTLTRVSRHKATMMTLHWMFRQYAVPGPGGLTIEWHRLFPVLGCEPFVGAPFRS